MGSLTTLPTLVKRLSSEVVPCVLVVFPVQFLLHTKKEESISEWDAQPIRSFDEASAALQAHRRPERLPKIERHKVAWTEAMTEAMEVEQNHLRLSS